MLEPFGSTVILSDCILRMVHEVAAVEDQVIVALSPLLMQAADALIETVGSMLFTTIGITFPPGCCWESFTELMSGRKAAATLAPPTSIAQWDARWGS